MKECPYQVHFVVDGSFDATPPRQSTVKKSGRGSHRGWGIRSTGNIRRYCSNYRDCLKLNSQGSPPPRYKKESESGVCIKGN